MESYELLIIDFLNACKSNERVKKYTEGKINEEKRKYLGWVASSSNKKNKSLELNLKNESELFLLFVLASAWSATGQWENAATLVYTLKNDVEGGKIPEKWITNKNMAEECNTAVQKNAEIFSPRKRIKKIRSDIYFAIKNIAKNWTEIKSILSKCDASGDWAEFFYQIREIKGVAPDKNEKKKLLIKIPLILREMRCQEVYQNIPGELCCVPDARVVDQIKKYNISAETNIKELSSTRPATVESLINSSKKIYSIFGDLYDMPLFAAEDIYE
jgi:hypothetical protein